MVQLETLLPILLENDADHAAEANNLNVQDLIEELSNHGIYTDVDLLFAPPTVALSIDASRLNSIKDKIANFLSAEGSSADEVYTQSHASVPDGASYTLANEPCSVGIESVDKLLGGGWTGEVVEVLGDKGTGKTWLALHAVLRHLHTHPNENALWLDTTGSFSAEWGSKILQSITRLHTPQVPVTSTSSPLTVSSNVEPVMAVMETNGAGQAVHEAPSALDRLIVAKVFDLQSAIQAIHQIRNQGSNGQSEEAKREESKVPAGDRQEEAMVPDSEATIYSDIVPETGMPAEDTLLQSSPGREEHLSDPHEQAEPEEKPSNVPPHLRFIVIDSISALLKGVLSATSAEGHARMMSFMRLLRSLTSSCTNGSPRSTTVFVINNLVSLASTANSPSALHSVFPALNAKKVKAALGPTFTYLTDWTIYLSCTKEVFRAPNSIENGSSEEVESVIFEVVRSRRLPQGRWAILPLYS